MRLRSVRYPAKATIDPRTVRYRSERTYGTVASKASGLPLAIVTAKEKNDPYSMPQAIVCHSGRCSRWLRWATIDPSADRTTARAVEVAAGAGAPAEVRR